jgi:nitroreductase
MPDPSPTHPIESRRTARRFDPDQPIADAVLERLLSLATLAPSPMNLQPWRFLVVRDPKNRRKLRACTFGDERITQAPVTLVVLAYLHPDRTSLEEVIDGMVKRSAIRLEEAARLRATATRDWERGDLRLRAVRAAMLAAGTLMIAAEALGLGSAWIDGSDDEKVRASFGIPDDHALCGLLAIGYATDAPPFPGRLSLDRVSFAEHFGLPWPTEADHD